MELKDIWDECHKNFIKDRKDIVIDDWLDDFNAIIEISNKPIIDLGCGSGNDTLYLINKGKETISLDCSNFAINKIKENIPETTAILQDFTKGLPFEDNFTDVIIADLSLHYFSEEVTKKIIAEIKRVLMTNGHLFVRVNSVNDKNYCANSGEEIEKHFYLLVDKTKGVGETQMTKRFFDEADIREFFKDWEIEYINEEKMDRYGNGKVLWKVSLKNIK